MINIKKHHDFVILQFTDLHLMKHQNDDATFQLMKQLSRQENPDLIVITGDITHHEENLQLFQTFSDFMEELKIPFALVFGNHDQEGFASKQELAELIMKNPYSLFQKGKDSLHGLGNYLIDLAYDNKPFFTLYFLDTNQHLMHPIGDELIWGYEGVYEDQIEWFQEEVKKRVNHTKSILFLHIPFPEFDPVDGSFEIHGQKLEGCCVSLQNRGLFDVIKENKNTIACFAGHDHYNDFQFKREGILLAYGRQTGYYDYLDIVQLRGCRKIVIHPDQTISTSIILETRTL